MVKEKKRTRSEIKDEILNSALASAEEREPRNTKDIAGTAVGFGAGAVVGSTGRALNQSINIATGNINPGQITKLLFGFVILMLILLLVITLGRIVVMSLDAMACNVGNTGCAIWGTCDDCVINSPTNDLSTNFVMWDIEWYIRALLYLGMAGIVITLAYIWGKWLLDKLLRIDYYIAKIDSWIFGTQFEGTAESQIDQKL